MSQDRTIKEAIDRLSAYYRAEPEKARGADKEAVAVLEGGLRARAVGPDGQALVCDLPKGMGGSASAPTPGWCMRAALANCEVIMLALGAAMRGITLTTLEVRVDSVSDDRGMLGADEAVPAGPLNAKVTVRLGAPGVSPEEIRELVEWAQRHSPVGDPLERRVPLEHVLEIV